MHAPGKHRAVYIKSYLNYPMGKTFITLCSISLHEFSVYPWYNLRSIPYPYLRLVHTPCIPLSEYSVKVGGLSTYVCVIITYE